MSATATATASAHTEDAGLRRVLGRWDLVALVINGIVGAGIFGLPSKVHALLGSWGIAAIVACALLIGLVILCFAEVGSRFTGTGGPYLYTRAAFGARPAFVVGWLLWLARIAGIGAITSLLVQYLSAFFPAIAHGLPRAIFLTTVVMSLTAVNITGVLRAARIGDAITIAKLLPLLVFVGVGLLHVQGSAFDFAQTPSNANFSSGVLLLAFAFVGWESAVVTAGELRDPRRDLPFALIVGLAVVIVLYLAIQVVSVGTLPTLAGSERPLADAARTFLGPFGSTMITVGAVISMLGTVNGGLLTISRIPFAMADAGQLPPSLARLHPRYRTPVVSIVVSSVVVLALTLTSTFTYVATISTVARLLVFGVTCAALPVLRRQEQERPARFQLTGGPVIAVAALLLIGWLLASTSWHETRDVLLAALVGLVIFGGWRVRPTNR